MKTTWMALGSAVLAGGLMSLPALAATDTPTRKIDLPLRAAIEQSLEKNFDVRVEHESGLLAQAQLESAKAAYVPTVSFGTNWARTNTPGTSSTTGGATTSVAETTSFTGSVDAALPTGGTLEFSTDLARSSHQAVTGTSGVTSLFNQSNGTLGVVTLTQPLLKGFSIDTNRLTIAQRRLDLRNAGLTAFGQAIDTVAAVEQAYYQLVAARETVKVREAALALAQQTVTDTEAKRQIGTVAPLEAKQAQSSAASAETDLISARQAVRERENALKLLITDKFAELRETEIVPTDPLTDAAVTLDYAESARRGLAARPDLGEANLTVAQRELSVRYQRNQRLPQVNLAGSYGLNGADTNNHGVLSQWRDRDHPAYSVGVTVSFPWTNKKTRNDLRAAEIQQRQAQLQLQKQEDVIRGEIDSAITSVRANFEKISSTRRAREYAEAALAAEQDKLNAGKSTVFNVLQLQRDLTSARADELSALADYNAALSTLRQREASTLEFWRIDLDRGAPATRQATSTSQP